MRLCAVALVLCDAVLRILAIEIDTDPVTRHLGKNRCRRNAHALCVALDYCFSGNLKISRHVAVNNGEISLYRKPVNGSSHSQKVGFKNI